MSEERLGREKIEVLFESNSTDLVKQLGIIDNIVKQMGKSMSGTNFATIWGDAGTVLKQAKDALKQFSKEANNVNASNLIKYTQALQALDVDIYTKEFSSFFDEIERAKAISPITSRLFDVADLKDAFQAFQDIEDAGGNVSQLFGKLSENSSQSAIRVRELEQELSEVRTTLISTQDELSNWKAGDGVKNMEAQLQAADAQAQSLQETLEMTRNTAESEFRTWLGANNLDTSLFGNFSHLFDAIQDGSMTANEAITNVKSNYGYLLEEFAQTNGALPSGAFDTLTSKLDEISAKMAELGSGGVGTNAVRELASGLSESTNITEQERVALSNLAQTANGDLPSVVQVIEALFSSIQQVGEGTNTATTSVSSFVSELRQLSGEGVESLSALSDMFTSLARNRDLSVGSLKGLTDFVTAIGGNEFAHIGNLTQLSGVDLRKFSELKVSKAALTNLATFLPAISEVNVGSLQSLADIKWDNLSNVKVDKSSISAIADMANMNESLGRMESAFSELGGQLTEISSKFKEMKEAAQSGTRDTFARGFNLKSATNEVNKFESSIGELRIKMSELGASGADTSKLSASLNDANSYIKSFRDNIDATGKVINKDLARSSLDGLRESMVAASNEAAKMEQSLSTLDSLQKSVNNRTNTKTVLSDPESFDAYSQKMKDVEAAYASLQAKVKGGLDLGTQQGQAEIEAFKAKVTEAETTYQSCVAAMNQKKLADTFDADSAATKVDKVATSLEGLQSKIVDLGTGTKRIDTTSLFGDFAAVQQAIEKFRATPTKDTFDAVNAAMDKLKENLQSVQSSAKSLDSLEKGAKNLASALKSVKDEAELKALTTQLKDLQDKLKAARDVVQGGGVLPTADIEALTQQEAELGRRIDAVRENSQGALDGVTQGAKEAESSMSGLSGVLQQVSGLLGNTMIGKIGSMAIGRAAMYIRRVAREMVSSAVDIESSLAQLQVITGASGSQLETFFAEGATAAKEYGTEVADMLDSVTTFSRLGLIA